MFPQSCNQGCLKIYFLIYLNKYGIYIYYIIFKKLYYLLFQNTNIIHTKNIFNNPGCNNIFQFCNHFFLFVFNCFFIAKAITQLSSGRSLFAFFKYWLLIKWNYVIKAYFVNWLIFVVITTIDNKYSNSYLLATNIYIYLE